MIKRATTSLGMLLLAAALSGPADAQKGSVPNPQKLSAARALIDAQGGIAQVRKVLARMTQAIVAQARRGDPAEADGLEKFLKTYVGTDNKKVNDFFADISESMAQFYAERCTIEELTTMTTFLQSPAGKRFVELAPESGAVVAPRMMEFQKSLMADIMVAARSGAFKKP